MSNLFMIILLISIIALIVGMVKPDLVLRFLGKEKRNRKYVLLVFGIAAFTSFILVGITAPDMNSETVAEKKPIEEIEEEKVEKDSIKLSAHEKDLLISKYSDLDNLERMKVNSIIEEYDEYNKADKKIISENKGKIVEDKIAFEEKKEAEKEQKKKETKEKEEKKAEESAQKEKEKQEAKEEEERLENEAKKEKERLEEETKEKAKKEEEEKKEEQEIANSKSSTNNTASKSKVKQSQSTEKAEVGKTVLVTKTGSKYHSRKCGNGNFYEATLEEAKARGLTPCSKCF